MYHLGSCRNLVSWPDAKIAEKMCAVAVSPGSADRVWGAVPTNRTLSKALGWSSVMIGSSAPLAKDHGLSRKGFHAALLIRVIEGVQSLRHLQKR